MDHAVSLVQAYLQLNGYFTSAEHPIIVGAGRGGFRTMTDVDILAFRFPNGLFVCQDNTNTEPGKGNQNFKYVPLDQVVPPEQA